MTARTQKKQLPLDANIVFDLAGKKDFAHDFRELFQSKGYGLVLPPTAVHELHLIFADGDSEAERYENEQTAPDSSGRNSARRIYEAARLIAKRFGAGVERAAAPD